MIELIKSLNEFTLPDVSETVLSLDERFVMLCYTYIHGNHQPTSIQQIVTILKILEKIHTQGYVHSDIRKENLVFWSQ